MFNSPMQGLTFNLRTLLGVHQILITTTILLLLGELVLDKQF
jgi:hypothetical protein